MAQRRKPMSEINVVPYIDVMLVLLIIFMVTAPMLTQGVKVDLPEITSDPVQVPDNLEPLVVSIDSNGAYFLEIGEDSSKPMPLESVTEKVRKILTTTPATPVLVRGDKHVEYGKVVSLMSALQGAGAKGVGLVTENP